MKKKIVLFSVIALIFAALGMFWGIRQHQAQAPGSAVASHLLDQTMPDVNGKPQPLAQWKNKALIVNFWATWCSPCVEEMPELSALQAEISPEKIQIIGIGVDSAANIAKFVAEHKITYPLYTGGMGAAELSRQFGNKAGALPFTVLIGRDGQIRKTYLGRLKIKELRNELKTFS